MTSTENDVRIWGIHAGTGGVASGLFLNQNVVALGWPALGDLSKIQPNRDAFKKALIAAYGGYKPSAVPIVGGQLYRFVHEIKTGDLVIYPSKDRRVRFGKVIGDYVYNPGPLPDYPNHRPVEWLKDFPRTHFSQGALYEIGSALTLFSVQNNAEEFLAALMGHTAPVPVSADPTIAPVAEEIEDTTTDFVLKTLAQKVKGHEFAHFVAHLLNQMGYYTRVSPPGPDGGIDIIAHKDELGFEPPLVKVQVKSSEGSSGDPVVSALFGKVGYGEFGLFVTLGSFTNQARTFEKTKANLRLIDGTELVQLILANYDKFDSHYKSVLPLKRVFVPGVSTSDE